MRTDLQQLKRVTESGQITASAAMPAAAAVRRRRRYCGGAVPSEKEIRVENRGGGSGGGGGDACGRGSMVVQHAKRAQALTQMDTIVLADFINKTGDPIFDDTLRQGLAAQLQQSPFLSLVSEQRIQQTLRLMGQPADSKLPAAVAADLCQRTGSKAYLSGAIASIGSQYVIELAR